MPSFRADRAAAAAVALAALIGGPGAAQLGPPIRLGPPTTQSAPVPRPQPQPAKPIQDAAKPAEPQPAAAQEQETAAPPASAQPAQPAAPAPPVTAAVTPEPRSFDLPRTLSGIEVAPIGAIDPDSIGVLGPADGGFGPDLWRGTDRGFLEQLLSALPGANGSPTLRGLARRLLLTQASVPPRPADAPPAASLLALRIERLIAIGDTAGALDLIRAAPQHMADEIAARGELESLFYAGDTAAACARARSQRRDATPYLQQAAAFCLAHDGDMARATVVAGLMREQSSDAGDPFFMLIDALASGAAPAIDARDPTGLQLAMLRAASAPPPASAVSSRNGAVLRSIAYAAESPAEARLAAAERAYVSGILADEDIVELYNAAGFPAERIKAPLAGAEDEWGPITRALLIRTAASEANLAARSEILQRTLAIATRKGGRDAVLRVGGIVARDIDPGLAPRGFAPDGVRMLLAAGSVEPAIAWIGRADGDAAVALWPYARLIDGGWNSAAFAKWLAELRKSSPDAAQSRAALLVSLCAGLGATIPNSDWVAAMPMDAAPRPAPGPVLLKLLEQAAAEKRVGETVLLAAMAIGEAGPAEAHPYALSTAIAALKAIGLAREAHMIALEAALAAGL